MNILLFVTDYVLCGDNTLTYTCLEFVFKSLSRSKVLTPFRMACLPICITLLYIFSLQHYKSSASYGLMHSDARQKLSPTFSDNKDSISPDCHIILLQVLESVGSQI